MYYISCILFYLTYLPSHCGFLSRKTAWLQTEVFPEFLSQAYTDLLLFFKQGPQHILLAVWVFLLHRYQASSWLLPLHFYLLCRVEPCNYGLIAAQAVRPVRALQDDVWRGKLPLCGAQLPPSV